MILQNKLDIIAIQGATKNQILQLLDLLNGKEISVEDVKIEINEKSSEKTKSDDCKYEWYGVGQYEENGNYCGEFCAIFYKPSTLKLIDKGAFWLSEEPEEKGSKSWDAIASRVCVYCKFKNQPGTEFLVFNTHWDQGRDARRQGAKLIRNRIDDMMKQSVCECIVMGDLNCTSSSNTFKILSTGIDEFEEKCKQDSKEENQQQKSNENQKITEKSPLLKNTADLVTSKSNISTFTGYDGEFDTTIDFILVSEYITAKSWNALTDNCPDGRKPSQHRPIVVDLVV